MTHETDTRGCAAEGSSSRSMTCCIWALRYIRRIRDVFLKPFSVYFGGIGREDRILGITAILVIGFFLSVAFHYWKGVVEHLGFPRNTFLSAPPPFGDYLGVHSQWTSDKFAGTGYGLSYFPSTYLFIDPFTKLFKVPNQAAIAFVTIFSLCVAAYAYKSLRAKSNYMTLLAVFACFLSYPFLFTFFTGNVEAFVFVGLALFVCFYVKKEHSFCTSLFLAIPVSMKLFPAVFFVLMLSDKRYKEMFYTVLWVIILTIVPLLIFRGGILDGFSGYIERFESSQSMYKELMIMDTAGIHFGHSLLGAMRIVLGQDMPPMKSILLPYLILALAVFGVLSLYIVKCEKALWKKIVLLVIAMCLLPYTSTDYKLVHFLIPLFVFVNTNEKERLDSLYLLLFGLLLIPKDYIYFDQNPLYSLNQVMNPCIMIVFVLLIVVSHFAHRKHWECSPSATIGT
jgi:hypothetical protein